MTRVASGRLAPTPARGGFGFRLEAGAVQPVAAGDRLFAVSGGKLVALDAATGRTVREYSPPAPPLDRQEGSAPQPAVVEW